jgi:hypothetical protein
MLDALQEMIAFRRAGPPHGGRGETPGQDARALDLWASLAEQIDRLSDVRGQRDASP